MLIYDVILDVGTTGCQQEVSLYQGDDRLKMLCITLLQHGRPYPVGQDLNVRLHGVKADDAAITMKCGVRGGRVYYLPAANATDTQGTVLCQLQIRDHSGAVLFSPEFSMQIVSTLPVPELPEGASEEAEYNAEVLSELSASADGTALLFRGEPVGIVRALSELPQTAEEGTIVYRIGEGLYRFAYAAWNRLTNDALTTDVQTLNSTSHTHSNKSALDDVTAAVVTNSHTHSNKSALDDVTAAVVTNSHTHGNKSTLDAITAEKITRWIGAAANSHTHSNKSALDLLTVTNGNLQCNGKYVGVLYVESGSGFPSDAAAGTIIYSAESDTFHRKLNTGSWVSITHKHTNYNALARISGTADSMQYNGKTIPLTEPDIVTLLGFGTYSDLVVRDVAISGSSIQDVPVYTEGGTGVICELQKYVDGAEFNDSIALMELRQYDTGMPVRVVRTIFDGVIRSYFPIAYNSGLQIVQAGWNSNNQPCDPPTITDFTPDRFRFAGTTYDDLTNLPDNAASALRSLSHCINVSAAALGTISVPDDAVLRFSGTFEPNRKYTFKTGDDCTFTLPTVSWSEKDAQFVLYLKCTADVDLTFPNGTVFAAGLPNSETGTHKLIGSYLRGESEWAIGGVDYEAVT